MESLKKGDTLYLQSSHFGEPRLFAYKIVNLAPKKYILENGEHVRKEDLKSINNQFVVIPEASFVAQVNFIKARSLAKDSVDELRVKICNRKLTKEQYESIVEFVKQFEDK